MDRKESSMNDSEKTADLLVRIAGSLTGSAIIALELWLALHWWDNRQYLSILMAVLAGHAILRRIFHD
jgi:hypothetical protein